MKTIKFLPIFIGMLLSFAACGDEEKEEVNNEPLYQYEEKDLPAIVINKSQLDGYWIEVSSEGRYYAGKSQTIGDRIYHERMYDKRSILYDINDFSHSGDNNAWCAFSFMPKGNCDYLAQYRMCYLFKENSLSLEMEGYWDYNNGIIHVYIVRKQEYSNEDDKISIDYKIISFDGDEMTLRQMEENMVVDKVFRKFDIERVNQVLEQEKETL